MTKKSPDLSDFDAVAAASGPRKLCSVRIALDGLPADQAASLQAALDDPKYTHVVIARTVTSWGHKVNPEAAGRHRKHECNCG